MKNTYNLDYELDNVCAWAYTMGTVDIEGKSSWAITEVFVERQKRRQGYGTKVLKLVTDDADKLGVALVLEVVPGDGLDYQFLHDWYARHGFQDKKEGYMSRAPRQQRITDVERSNNV